jgi:hypothetical protein
MTEAAPSSPQNDWARRPGPALIWWCIPLSLALAFSLTIHASRIVAGVWVIALGWMGIGCALNAMRCHRLHCYFSGPILLLGALAAGLIGFDVVTLGPHAFNDAISLALMLALLSFVPEMVWSKYRHLERLDKSC